MAFKLTRSEQNRRDELVSELQSHLSLLETAINQDPPDSKQISTNAALFVVSLEEAEQFREEVAERLREEFDERSEKWQESDKGDEVSSFIDEWESADFSDPGVDLMDPDISGLDEFADNLEALPTEV
jgi:hypothetical protein